jgi:hypothetical protein
MHGLKKRDSTILPDYLKVQVDSTVADHQVDCQSKKETPLLAQTQYRINDIIVYPNYSINADSLVATTDSVVNTTTLPLSILKIYLNPYF